MVWWYGVVQCDGMSFLDYKKKHQTLPDTSRNSHKYQEYQLRERGLQRDESFSVNDDCLEVINYKAEQRYEQQICICIILISLLGLYSSWRNDTIRPLI